VSHPAKAQLDLHGLPQSVVNKICTVFARYPAIEQVILYGSRAKGTQHKGSDIDLTLVGKSVTEAQMLALETQLDDLLLPYKIDLCRFEAIQNPELVEHINRVGLLFFKQ
jgi:predicted nucleotidyltransferase